MSISKRKHNDEGNNAYGGGNDAENKTDKRQFVPQKHKVRSDGQRTHNDRQKQRGHGKRRSRNGRRIKTYEYKQDKAKSAHNDCRRRKYKAQNRQDVFHFLISSKAASSFLPPLSL